MNIFAHAAKLEELNTPFALANILETSGSAPRHQGQMIVKADGTILGTIGGGMIERFVIEQAIEAIQQREPRVVKGRMTRTGPDAMNMDCGGTMSVHIDVFGLRAPLILIGAGHVNRAVAQAAHALGFDITVVDTYADSLAEENFPLGSKKVFAETMAEAIDKLTITEQSYLVIATNHEDKDAISKIVKQDAKYIGLMASKRKSQTLLTHLKHIGIGNDRIQSVYSPIGFSIGAETPEEIAVSIMAEILKIKNGAAGGQMRDNPRINKKRLVLIRGAGDIATGVAIRLHNAGFKVVMTDIAKPTIIRRSVSFAQCIFDDTATVEGITAKKADSCHSIFDLIDKGIIPVLVDDNCKIVTKLCPNFVVDAILAKRNLGTTKELAPHTVALGPGFMAGVDCDAVIETNRGHHLGRIIYKGETAPNTGIPGNIGGYTHQRVLRSPEAGIMHCCVSLGDIVKEGELIAQVNDTPIIAPMSGKVRGLLNEGLEVHQGLKIGDIDPRGCKADHLTVSDKARAIGGSVLEALLHLDMRSS
ncbi:MAG: selenium-dependent molybdenum cofactor biosynthesis protein YqeB [Shewanella sp.]